jgi:hypothetical protein
MNLAATYPEPHPQTAGRVIDGEAVLILSDSAEINVLNPVGSRIFELIDGETSLEQIVETIVQEYNVNRADAERDTVAFVQELVDHQVLILTEMS